MHLRQTACGTLCHTLFPEKKLDEGHVINIGQPPSFHSLNPINTKHQETLQKNENNYKTKM